MRWTALHFPDLPLQVYRRCGCLPEPAAVETPGAGARIVACCRGAAAAGVRPGMVVSAALALAPGLALRPRDEALEMATLERVAAWAQQFTSRAGISAPAAVLLETGGSERLFQGPRALLERLKNGLETLGMEAALSTAPTPLAAEWLARTGIETVAESPDAFRAWLPSLPVALLPLPAPAFDSLRALGLRTIADCLKLPRHALARRFGDALPNALDRALGRLPDPRPPFAAPLAFSAGLEFPAPVVDAEALLFGLKRLLHEFCGFLEARREGAMRALLLLAHEHCPATELELRLAAPGRDPAALTALFREKLACITLSRPVAGFTLVGAETAPLGSRNLSLFGTQAQQAESLALLTARLRARLGEQAVTGLAPFPDHRPERAFRETEPGTAAEVPSPGRRPLWLLPEPAPLPLRQDTPWLEGPLALLAGPERIESGWWDGADVARDYFVARNPEGETFWIFRDRRTPAWFLHGIFA